MPVLTGVSRLNVHEVLVTFVHHLAAELEGGRDGEVETEGFERGAETARDGGQEVAHGMTCVGVGIVPVVGEHARGGARLAVFVHGPIHGLTRDGVDAAVFHEVELEHVLPFLVEGANRS